MNVSSILIIVEFLRKGKVRMHTKSSLLVFLTIVLSYSNLCFSAFEPPKDERSKATCVESSIENVVVYPNQAEVTREITLDIKGKGQEWFCLRSLPINLRPASLKIKFPNQPGLNDHIVLEKVYRLIQLKQVIQQKMKALEGLLAKRLGADQKLRLNRQVMNFLKNLRFRPQLGDQNQTPLTFQASDRKILSSLETITSQIASVRKKIQASEDEIMDLEESIQQLKVDLNQQNNLQTQSWSYDLYFTVGTKKGKYKAEVKYLVPNVTWNPLYDVRADIDPKNSKINLRLITLAELKQNTLEDWENVQTEFASLEPLSLYMPPRDRWIFEEVREEAPMEKKEGFFGKLSQVSDMVGSQAESMVANEVMSDRMDYAPAPQKSRAAKRSRSAKRMEKKKYFKPGGRGGNAQGITADLALEEDAAFGSSMPSAPNIATNFSMAPTNRNLFALGSVKEIYGSYGQMVSKIDQISRQYADQRNIISRYTSRPSNLKQNSSLARKANGRNITYKAKIPISLERTDSPLRVPLESKPLKAELSYLSIPHKDRNVYIRAKVINTTAKPILGGKAQIFINGKLTTKTNLNSISERGTFFVDLGMDKNVEVERIVDRSSVDEGVLFKKHKTKVDITIKIANRHNFPIKLTLGDRQPISPHKEIEIKNLKVSDKGDLKVRSGQITWDLNLKAKEKKDIKFSYSVTHPENFLVSELN